MKMNEKTINTTMFYIETENGITSKMVDLSIRQEFNLDGYDIIIDPYTLAPDGKIRVIVNKDNEHKIKDIDKKETIVIKLYNPSTHEYVFKFI